VYTLGPARFRMYSGVFLSHSHVPRLFELPLLIMETMLVYCGNNSAYSIWLLQAFRFLGRDSDAKNETM
jgi:hypothetical protein